MSLHGKSILEQTLGKLLGFEDGAADVLEHLLSIESKEDLSEYLSQLLGDSSPEMQELVDNIGRFQRGETIGANDIPAVKPQAEGKLEPSKNVVERAPPVQRPQGKSKKQNLQAARRNPKQHRVSRVPPPKKAPPPTSSAAPKTEAWKGPSKPAAKQAVEPAKKIAAQPVVQPSKSVVVQPKKGDAKHVCGCFGTVHKALTNCLNCGRISCVQEGYDYCAFCGLMVEPLSA